MSNYQTVECLTLDEIKAIDACYNPDTNIGVRNLAIIHCMLDAGMRSGEVQQLRIGDVDFDKNLISVRDIKYGRHRLVPIAIVLKDYLKRYIDARCKAGVCTADDFVFMTPRGPLSENAVKCIFQRLKVKSGIERLYPYLFRHTFALSYLLCGGTVERLKVYMGHTSVDTTRRYLYVCKSVDMSNLYLIDSCFFKPIM